MSHDASIFREAGQVVLLLYAFGPGGVDGWNTTLGRDGTTEPPQFVFRKPDTHSWLFDSRSRKIFKADPHRIGTQTDSPVLTVQSSLRPLTAFRFHTRNDPNCQKPERRAASTANRIWSPRPTSRRGLPVTYPPVHVSRHPEASHPEPQEQISLVSANGMSRL